MQNMGSRRCTVGSLGGNFPPVLQLSDSNRRRLDHHGTRALADVA